MWNGIFFIFYIFIKFPLGWSKSYEFNESDLKVACDMLDTWIDATSLGRTNLPPDRVPWKAILTLLSQCIYGGKIDNEFDQRLLLSFLEKLFNAKCFEVIIWIFFSLAYGPKKIKLLSLTPTATNFFQMKTIKYSQLSNNKQADWAEFSISYIEIACITL